MKTLQLKNYLLVEPENPVYLTVSESGLFYADPETEKSELIEGKFKLLCMGDEFEKDQQAAKKEGCVLGQLFSKIGFDAFVKEVEEAGFYWGENPLGNEPEITNDRYKSEREFIDNNPEEIIFGDHFADWHMWTEAEALTFNPSKTKIYQVL